MEVDSSRSIPTVPCPVDCPPGVIGFYRNDRGVMSIGVLCELRTDDDVDVALVQRVADREYVELPRRTFRVQLVGAWYQLGRPHGPHRIEQSDAIEAETPS